ncbi:FAD-dependent oxidoreductase [Lentzea sp. NPDC004782]|uniref:FAD-dependent oxidoreductase n=1 Tax=Lentzea sp. NPDC004782 TaxID=3154458 RepID=UPI0033B1B2D8
MIAVVGAGPVGLTAAVVLARAGVPVTVLERGPALGTASRASTFHPATLDLLAGLGVAEEFIARGRKVHDLQWRSRTGELLTRMSYAAIADRTAHPFRLHAEQTELTPLLLEHVPDIRWNTEVVDVRQDTDGVELITSGGTIRAEYVIAADGAHSTVRTKLGLGFPGVEYPTCALRVITTTELDRLLPGLSPMTYFRDPAGSCSVLGLPDHWRVILRLPHQTGVSVEALLHKALPTLADRIEVRDAHTYRTSRRVIDNYKVGRVLFAGDAAHLTSTAGGMNMNCGIHDAVDLATALIRGSALLDEAARRRRNVVTDHVIPRSEARVSGVDGQAGSVEAAVRQLAATASDPAEAAQYLVQASMLDSVPKMIQHSLEGSAAS